MQSSSQPRLSDAGTHAWPVMVLVHNEERRIKACLDSIFAADRECQFDVYVMANGCTDCSEQIVRAYANRRPQVHLVSIALGDKCNAWNIFIHDTVPTYCPGREIYFFMDGDVRVVPGSFTAMMRALQRHPQANAASAMPASGRNVVRDREELLREHGLVANLYALRGKFVERLRAHSVRVPLRLEGDDGLIGAFVKWDLNPTDNRFDDDRIVPCTDAAFEFEPLSPMRLTDWKMYWKRAVRYGRRHYEFRLLGPVLENRGLGAMPADITELYRHSESLSLRWQGIYTLANFVALRQMRRMAR